MHHRDKGWLGERTTRRGRVVGGQEPKEKPNPYQRAMATGCRHTRCLTSGCDMLGWVSRVGESNSPRQRPLVRRIPTALR